MASAFRVTRKCARWEERFKDRPDPDLSRRSNCMVQARGLLQALASVGMTIVWEYDQAMQPAVTIETAIGENGCGNG